MSIRRSRHALSLLFPIPRLPSPVSRFQGEWTVGLSFTWIGEMHSILELQLANSIS
ncbi:hypothetical protein CDEST_14619 [Colletotrichum destructivum]|uniref:Uncharacterized protein n=1 Tax=Colletotrichum destructivum TaxID=34406 RepID=A0AAX4J2E4_9PEZI|nr:hypothetical protein CDEST_14619 [Colletotrichum destructivum]